MPGFVAAELADQTVTEQVQIANCIQDLVLHELVFVAQAIFIQHPYIIQHDGVIEIAAEGEITRPHHLQIAHEAEGTGPAYFLQEGSRRKIHRSALRMPFEDRVIELDLEIDLEAVE